jgi:hypothetical protein
MAAGLYLSLEELPLYQSRPTNFITFRVYVLPSLEYMSAWLQRKGIHFIGGMVIVKILEAVLSS